MNQSIHTIDLLLYFCGDVRRLSATTATLTHQGIEVEDTAVAILEFANGARGVIQGSTSCWSSDGHPAEIQICGDRGSVFMATHRSDSGGSVRSVGWIGPPGGTTSTA